MFKSDFDEHAQNYRKSLNASLAPFGGKDNFFDFYKIYCLKKWAITENQSYDILDYGCGIGKITSILVREFPQSNIYGFDVSKESMLVAKKENAELKNIYFMDELSEKQKYDFIIAANVFHHIEPNERINAMNKIKNLLKSSGKIIIFEHNPLNPITRRIVSQCPFDKNAEIILRNKFIQLAKSCGLEIEFKQYIVFFPWPSKLFRNLEILLGFLPLGAQYMLVLKSK